jgi:ATPase subunit of ABC transporter with duplicated ATPase domains
MKIMKQRAMVNAKNASRAKAAETRWKRFAEAGSPPPPATSRPMKVRLTAAESAKRALVIDALGLDGLILPFSDVVRCGERLGLVGPNGTGKTHLLQMLAGLRAGSSGRIVLGPRVSVGIVTQVNERPAFTGQTVVHLVQDRVGNYENAMRVLARYGLERASTQNFETLSGGQKARLEVLALEVEGHNLLLLDEPTENLDVASSEALELALASFDGTCISVSHDRSFLKAQDRYWVLNESGVVHSILGYNDVLDALLSGTMSNNARPLTIEADAHRARRP